MPITALPPAPSRADPTNFSDEGDALLGALAQFVTEVNAVAVALDLNDTTSTSVTSLAISIASKSLTVDTAKSYQPGMSVKIARTSSPSNWMHGDVTSYDTGTGALVVNVLDILGSGTYTDWTITFSAPTLAFDTASPGAIGETTPNTIRGLNKTIFKTASADSPLTAAECSGTEVSNYGMTNADMLIDIAAAAAGLSFVFVAPAVRAHYIHLKGATGSGDIIYLLTGGVFVAGSAEGYVGFASGYAAGAMIAFMSIQTGAGTYDWYAWPIAGIVVAG